MPTQRIIELKQADFQKGISAQGNLPVGGLLQDLTGCDPFEKSGTAMPSLVPDSITPSGSTTPRIITNWNNGGTPYVYVHSYTKLIKILKDSPYTQTDITSQITVSGNVKNAIIWKNTYVYAQTDLRSVTFAGVDTQLKTGFNGSYSYMPLCIGADKNLYHGDDSRVGIITSVAGTSGNTGIGQIDNAFTVRELVNDGKYLVIFADNNLDPTTGAPTYLVGNYTCRVYFWDMVTTDGSGFIVPDFVYEFDGESYLTAARMIDSGIYVFGRNGLYVTAAGTKPKLIRSFIGSGALTKTSPLTGAQVTNTKGSIHWIDGGTDTLQKHVVNAFGNPTAGQPKIFYKPYQDTGTDQTQTVIQSVGDQFWVGNDKPIIYVHNVGSTRGNMSLTSIDTTLENPHRFEYTKVVLASALASGQTLSHVAVGANGSTTICATETKSYNSANPKQSFVFKRTPTINQPEKFEDLRVNVRTTGGAAIQRITTYATPLTDSNEEV